MPDVGKAIEFVDSQIAMKNDTTCRRRILKFQIYIPYLRRK
jgi:hypothetical protein